MTLSSRDVELLQAAVLDLHEPRDLDALGEATPRIFKRAISADYFLRIEFGQAFFASDDTPFTMWEHPARASREIIRKAMTLAPDHPFTEYVLRTGSLVPLRLSDFWTRRQQLASRIQQEVYRSLGVGRMLAIPIVRGGRAGAINLTRPFRSPDFNERDREMLGLLTPHFVLALGAAEAVSAQLDVEADALVALRLTSREREVASWLSRGRTNPEIAEILATRPRTVEKHVERILLKLDVENRTAAARVILGLGSVGALATAPEVARVRETLLRQLRPGGAARKRRDGARR